MLLRKIYLPFSQRAISIQSILTNNLNSFIYTKQRYLFSTSSLQTLHLTHHLKSDKTIDVLNKKGINSFFPIQSKTFAPIYQGFDVIAGDKTGSGKTMAFALPVIQKLRSNNEFNMKNGLKFIVLAPTRQLAVQIGNQIQSLKHTNQDFRVLTVFGGFPVFLNEKQLLKNPDILVGTPGRITDLMQRGLLNFKNVKVICIDEADFMFDIGFKENVDNILLNIKQNCQKKFQILCFSATINKDVADLTKKFMNKDKLTIKLTNQNETKAPTTIKHQYVQVKSNRKIQALRHLIKKRSNNGKVIIFANTKVQAGYFSQNLNIKNVLLHGDVEQKSRLNRLKSFKQGRVDVLIASDVAARGLDIPNVQLVINYDVTKNTQNYIHRSGRTGRAGKLGVCITIVQPQNVQQLLNKTKKANINLSKIYISNQQYQQVQDLQLQKDDLIKQNVQTDQQYLSNELVIFPRKNDNVQKSDLLNFLKTKNVYCQVRQQYSRSAGQKYYRLIFNNPEDTTKILNQRFPIPNQEKYIRFLRRRLLKQSTN